MPLPSQPVTLTVEQIRELNKKISDMRHDVNNDLALMMASVELIRRKPESAERMWKGLTEKPLKVANAVTEFSHELEKILGITRP
jgi:hypothetical protein